MKELILEKLSTPVDMLDYLIAHYKTMKAIYPKNTRHHSFYRELLNDLETFKYRLTKEEDPECL